MKQEQENVRIEAPETEIQEQPKCYPSEVAVEKAIRGSVYTSMGIGIVPIPLFNLAAATAGNLNLIRKLANLYGVEFKESVARNIITAVLGASASTFATPVVETVLAGIPVVGLALVVGTKPALNGTVTYALGRMFATHFEKGGSFVGVNVEEMKKNFSQCFKDARVWLGKTIGGKEAEAST